MLRVNRKLLTLIGFGGFLLIKSAAAQQIDHYSADSLLEQAKGLEAKATSTNGVASETLQKYGIDFTMLCVRTKDGGAELHEKFADIFVIMDGSATLLSEGEIANPTSSGPGEKLGTSVLHAKTTHLSKGDVVHIPANTPHQLLIPKNGTLTYFVIKVQEKQ